MNAPSPAPHLLFVLTIEPERPGHRWRARLVQYAPTLPADGVIPTEFENPLELARYVAQVSIGKPVSGGLR